jgi:hypothetical protein
MLLHKSVAVLSVGVLLALGSSAIATADPVLEQEPPDFSNNSFADREVLPEGTDYVLGNLGLPEGLRNYDIRRSGELEADQANFIEIPDLEPSEPFYAWIDNSESGADTVLGVFSPEGTLLYSDDDGSLVGNGYASAVVGTVNPDGTIELGVSGYGDFDFDGMYDTFSGPDYPGAFLPEEPIGGAYQVFVQLGVSDRADVDTTVPDYTFNATLVPGQIEDFAVSELTPATPFFVWTDNTQSGVDTMLGTFDEAGNLIAFDDDGSPVGTGLASGLLGTVNDDGSIQLRISAFPDFNFDGVYDDTPPGFEPPMGFDPSMEGSFPTEPFTPGAPEPHGVTGAYELYVSVGSEALKGDVDYLAFPGLEPGSSFVATITLANFDTLMGWLDDNGQILAVNDDTATSVLSEIRGIVPASGVVNLVVSGYGDDNFDGTHTYISDYVLQLDTNPDDE